MNTNTNTKVDFICPRTHATATVEGCVECYVKNLPCGDRCAVTQLLRSGQSLRPAVQKRDTEPPKTEAKAPDAGLSLRRGIGCVGIVVSLAVLLAVAFIGATRRPVLQGLGVVALIVFPISVYVAFPMFAEFVWAVGTGMTIGNSAAKALGNLADMDKKD